MKTALTIAGFDPSAWAGVLADVKAFEAFGVQGMALVSALTAQNRTLVTKTQPVDAVFLRKQADALAEAFKIDAVKIGMLANAANVAVVAGIIKKRRFKNVVLDTVFCSTGGHELLDKKGVVAMRRLLPLATLVTPNIAEASRLSGLKIDDVADMEKSARIIHELGARNVLVKGGHLKGDPIDVLFDGRQFHYFKTRRIKASKAVLHGTGCILSSAIAASLAKGLDLRRAVKDAGRYLAEELERRKRVRV